MGAEHRHIHRPVAGKIRLELGPGWSLIGIREGTGGRQRQRMVGSAEEETMG